MINTDFHNTQFYKTQEWSLSSYISFNCINSSNLIYTPSFNLKSSTAWSCYSNLCSRFLKLNNIFLKYEQVYFSLECIKYILNNLINYINNKDIENIQSIIQFLNINKYEDLLYLLKYSNFVININIKNMLKNKIIYK